MSLMCMPAQTTVPPLATALRAAGTRVPTGAKLSGKLLRLFVARAGKGEDAPAFVYCYLGHDVGRGPEPVETELLGISSETQRAVTDQASAQQGSGLQICETFGDREAEAGVGNGVLGVAAVDLVPRKPGVLAKVLTPGETVAALAIGPTEPRHPDPAPSREVAGLLAGPLHGADYLVARDQGQLRIG